jgi:ankyrin repeat protein
MGANSEEFIYAAQLGDTEKVQQMLSEGADVNAKDQHLCTALMGAALNDFQETARLLIERGASVNEKNRNGWTALMYASDRGNTEMVELLAENGADINAVDSDGYSPLMGAAFQGHAETVKVLLQHGAETDLQSTDDDSRGTTALMSAAYNGHGEVVDLLLGAGADLNAVNVHGFTALRSAREKGFLEIEQRLAGAAGERDLLEAAYQGDCSKVRAILAKPMNINCRDKDGYTPLINAAMHGDPETVAALLQKGALIDLDNGRGFTPLMGAAKYGHNDVVKLLLHGGADLHAVSETSGWTAMLYAAGCGQTATVALLLDQGADLESLTDENWTALLYAVVNNHPETAKLLIERGANVNVQDENHFTPLMGAAKFGLGDVVELLLEHGADIQASKTGEDGGWTALTFASWQGKTDIVGRLLEHGAGIDRRHGKYEWSPLMDAISNGHEGTARFLVEHGADVNVPCADHYSPLMCASRHGLLETAKCLVEHGADIHAETVDFGETRGGWTALTYAVGQGKKEAAEFLLECGAKADGGRILSEDTPLILAVRRDQAEIASALLAHGASVNIRPQDGYTPLGYAVLNGNEQIIGMLLQAGADMELTRKSVDFDIDRLMLGRFIRSAGTEADWADEKYAGVKNAIKKTWGVDIRPIWVSEAKRNEIYSQSPRSESVRYINGEYMMELSDNSIFIHGNGHSFLDFGYVLFYYKHAYYYVNVEPAVTLTKSVYDREDTLSQMAKILITLLGFIGEAKNRGKILILLDGELKNNNR